MNLFLHIMSLNWCMEDCTMGYTLTVIEDEAVALSGSIPTDLSSKSPLFIGTFLMILLVGAVIIGAAYAIRLHYYQTRLDELELSAECESGAYNHKSIRSIKNQIAVVEGMIAESALVGFVPNL